MHAPPETLLQVAVRGATTGFTLAVLGGIGWWGHETHWQFIGGNAHGPAHAEHAKEGGHGKAKGNSEKGAKAGELPAAKPDGEGADPTEPSPKNSEPAKSSAPGSPGDSVAASPTVEKLKLPSAESEQAAGIRSETPRRQRVERQVQANGIVDYNRTRIAQLSSRTAGTIWRVETHVGEAVRAGDILAIIDSPQVGKAKAEFLASLTDLKLKETTRSNLKPLDGVVSSRAIREAETAVRSAEIAVYNAHQALVNLGLPIEVAKARTLSDRDLFRQVQVLGLPESVAKGMDPETSSANLIPLVAPFAGVVTGRDAVIGEAVDPGKPVFTLADLSRMWLLLDVRIEDTEAIALGQAVEFQPDGQKNKVTGKVSWIDAEVDPRTRTLKVRADVENPLTRAGDGSMEVRLLRANAFGTGRITVEARDDRLVISKGSIQWDDGRATVFVRRGGTEFERRSIRPGIERAGDVEVLDGLDPGDAVVVSGARLLHSESHSRRLRAE